MNKQANTEDSHHHQAYRQRQNRLHIAEKRVFRDPPAIEEKQRRDKQQQKDVRIEIDLKTTGGQRGARRNLDQRQRHFNGQKMGNEHRHHDGHDKDQHNSD